MCSRRCGTLTEVGSAYRLGPDMVMLFEAVPTDGVKPTVESLQAWYDTAVPAVGIGSRPPIRGLVAGADWDRLQQQITDAVAAGASARSKE